MPENSVKGILYYACSDENDVVMQKELHARNPGIQLVVARCLGSSRHVVIVFGGIEQLEYMRYWEATYAVRLFRTRIEACFNCRKVGT